MTKSHSSFATFRVRIGRIKMKDGGAELRILRRPAARNAVEAHLREWTSNVTTGDTAPDAYAAVALWLKPTEPGRPDYHCAYITNTDRLPTTMLVELATPYLRNDLAAEVGKGRTLEQLGWTFEGWNPDLDG
jgi:hypothetical protein